MSFGGLFDDLSVDIPMGGSLLPSDDPDLFSEPPVPLFTFLTKPVIGSSSMDAFGFGASGLKIEEEEESENLGAVAAAEEAEEENPSRSKKRKRDFRHSPEQIQELEALFKVCPHPDENQRADLSKKLRLQPRQIKFWFQNKRTQAKTQMERRENTFLRQEKEKLLAEKITMREALINPSCAVCGGSAVIQEVPAVHQYLKLENARLREQLNRFNALAGDLLLGRTSPAAVAPTLTSTASDLASGSASSPLSVVLSPPSAKVVSNATGDNKSVLLEIALVAMDELLKMAEMDEPLWIASSGGGREKLSYEEYMKLFHRFGGLKPDVYALEATKETGVVIINSSALVGTLMDADRWMEMFPGVIAKAAITDVISDGVGGTRNGALVLMNAELQVLSPLVPVREVHFLRFCKQLANNGAWAVVDVSVDGFVDYPSAANGSMKCWKLPSGCVIQDMPNGCSKVTWVEHAECDASGVHPLYLPLLRSGIALGAPRWMAALRRQSESLAAAACDLGGGRRSMLALAARMTASFISGICPSSRRWERLTSSAVGDDVRVMTRLSSGHAGGEPPGVVLSVATSAWLPVGPTRLFDFLRDERLRSEWDILSSGAPMQEVAHIAKGPGSGNAVSLLRPTVAGCVLGSMEVLQETSRDAADAAAATVVYAPVETAAMEAVMGGADPALVTLLPSGFAVVPEAEGGGDQGSLLTVGLQLLLNSLPSARMSVETVNQLIEGTVQKIKAALRCES